MVKSEQLEKSRSTLDKSVARSRSYQQIEEQQDVQMQKDASDE